jgi:hypothetical protein
MLKKLKFPECDLVGPKKRYLFSSDFIAFTAMLK